MEEDLTNAEQTASLLIDDLRQAMRKVGHPATIEDRALWIVLNEMIQQTTTIIGTLVSIR